MKWLHVALRNGVVPFCCVGATCCFALYGGRVIFAAEQWEALSKTTSETMESPHYFNYAPSQCAHHAKMLRQHAGTCAALAAVSTVVSVEAGNDWAYGYRSSPSLEQTERWLSGRTPFFLRRSVCIVALFGFVGAECWNDGKRLWAPRRPAISRRL